MLRWRNQVHFPTIALGGLWIIHSLATTMYIPWQNNRQQEALKVSLDTADTALKIQENLVELQSQSDGTASAHRELKNELLKDLSRLKDQPLEPDALASIRHMETQIADWEAGRDPPALALKLYELVEDVQSIIRAQQRHQLLVMHQRSETDSDVNIVRAVLLILGLLIGIGLALWMARGLNRSLAQINVTLRGAAIETNTAFGQIEISSEGPAGQLTVLETQVQSVVSKLHHVGEELQQTRHEMVQAERLAAVGELAAGIAHEIRNPLTSVKLLIQKAAERQPVHSLNAEQTAVLLEEISRMEATVQSLLDFARPEKPQKVPCELSAIVNKALALLDGRIQQRRVEVHISGGQVPLALHADPLLIQQVIVNIVINAIDFMPEGGDLWIRLDEERTTGTARLEIQDSGPGIDPAILERIFEPFVTTRSTGSGLGLTISRRVIEDLGGTLTASNSPEGGGLFQIRLPRVCTVGLGSDASELAPALKES